MYFVQYCHACISAAFVLSTKYSNVIKKKKLKKVVIGVYLYMNLCYFDT